MKYKHLFTYDFGSVEYITLVTNTERIKFNIDQFIETSFTSHKDYSLLKKLVSAEYLKCLSDFVNKLRTEIEY